MVSRRFGRFADGRNRFLPSQPEDFWRRVAKSEGCWTWLGATDRTGYGACGYGGKLWRAHRLSWTLTNGAIPPGLFVCHGCDIKLCVRPDHLFLGSRADNTQDALAKGLYGVAPERRARGDRVNTSKLTADQVKAIRERFSNGELRNHLAKEYGVSFPAIQMILTRKNWAHV